MAEQVVSDAAVFPQDEGLPNISDGNETWDSAGHLMALAQAVDSDSYVRSDSELTFSGHDGTNDTVDVTSGIAYLSLDGETVDVQSSLGGSTPAYDTTLPSLPAILVVVPSTVSGASLQDSTASDVWLAYDTDGTGPGSAGSVYVRSDDTGSVTEPSHPSVKLGSSNPDDSSSDVLENRGASPTFESVGAGQINTRQLNVAPSRSWGFDSIQAAVDEVDKSGSGDIGSADGAEIHLWEQTSETDITVSNKNLAIIGKASEGPTETTDDSVHIDHSGGDGLIVDGDQRNWGLKLENLAIDGGGSGQSIVLDDGLQRAAFDNVKLINAQDGFVHTGGPILNCNFDLIIEDMSRHALRFDWGSSEDFFNANHFERLLVRGVDVQRGIYVDIPSGADFGGNEFHNLNIEGATVSGATEMEIQGGNFIGNQFYGYGFEFNQDAPIINPDSGEGNHWIGGRLSSASHASAFETDLWDTFLPRKKETSSHFSVDEIDVGNVLIGSGLSDNTPVKTLQGFYSSTDFSGWQTVLDGFVHDGGDANAQTHCRLMLRDAGDDSTVEEDVTAFILSGDSGWGTSTGGTDPLETESNFRWKVDDADENLLKLQVDIPEFASGFVEVTAQGGVNTQGPVDIIQIGQS